MTSWLALVRLGWGNARRARRRTVLVMALIALPVAAVVGGATAARMAIPSAEDEVRGRFGRADVVLRASAGAEAAAASHLEAVLPDGARAVEVHNASARTADRYDSIFLTDAPVNDAIFEGRYRVLEGRAPTAAGEVAPDLWVTERYDLDVGDTLRFEGTTGDDLTVVGVAVQTERTHDQAAFVAPGSITERPSWYVDLGDATVEEFERALAQPVQRDTIGRPAGPEAAPTSPPVGALFEVEARDDPPNGPGKREATSAGVFAAGVVAVGLAGLVASASFAVSLRRRQRELGLLGAAGADARMLRRSVLLEGAVVGLLGGGVGAAVGLIAVLLIRLRLEEAAGRLFGTLELSAAIIIGGLFLGGAGAAFAAWLPARAAARQSVVEALAARRPSTQRRGRFALGGAVFAGGGLLLVAAGAASRSQPLLIGGALAAFAGVLTGAPVIIERLSAVAGPLPATARIGVRELARNRARSAALFAAVLAALTLPVAAVAAVRSERAHAAEQYVPAIGKTNMLLSASPGDAEPTANAGRLRAAVDQFKEEVEGLEVSGSIRPVLATLGEEGDQVRASGGSWSRRQKYIDPGREGAPVIGEVIVADRRLLEALGVGGSAAELEAGLVLGVGPGTVDGGAVELGSAAGSLGSVPAVETSAHPGFELPSYLIGEERAHELGFAVGEEQGWLFRLDHRPTAEERDVLFVIAARHDLLPSTEVGRFQPPVLGERMVLGLGGIAALVVVSIVAGLAAAEGRSDRVLLTAIGASPRAGRAAGALGTAVLVFLAGAAAAALGVGLVGAHQLGRGPSWDGGPGYTAAIPWNAITFAIAVVPSAALAITWLCNGRVDPRDVRGAR